MIARRLFVTKSSLLAAGVTATAAVSRGNAQGRGAATVEAIRVISQEPEYYHGWGTLARDAKGTLYTVASGGGSPRVPVRAVELMRSQDEAAPDRRKC